MEANKTLRWKLEQLKSDPLYMDHHIARDTGLALSAVQKIRSGQANLDNVRLGTAEKLADYYDQNYARIRKEYYQAGGE